MVREQRATMCQTEAQYRFLYYAISNYMRQYRSQAALQFASTTNATEARNQSDERLLAAENSDYEDNEAESEAR